MKTTQFDEIEDFNKAINNWKNQKTEEVANYVCLLYTSPSPRDS